MLTFECPLCQAKMQAADEYAGKSVLCPTCQRPATVPRGTSSDAIVASPGGPLPVVAPIAGVTTPEVAAVQQAKNRQYGDDDNDDERQRDNLSIAGGDRTSWMRLIITGGVIVSVFVVLAALLVPATSRVRESAARTQTINNLKQIGLAAQTFHDTYRRLPTNGVTEPTVPPALVEIQIAAANNSQSGGWLFKLIPYIDSTPIFNKPPRTPLLITAFMCPGRGRPACVTSDAISWSDFAINPFINSPTGMASAPDDKRSLVDVTDGSSNTIFAGHGHMCTVDYTVIAVLPAVSCGIATGGTTGSCRASTNNVRDTNPGATNTTAGWGSAFTQGCAFVMLDGTVRFFPYAAYHGGVIRDGKSTIPNGNTTLGIFLTPTGGEAVHLPD